MSKSSSDPVHVWTVGHSTRSFEELVTVLHDAGIEQLADVRTVPKSRRLPHFNQQSLEEELPKQGVRYVHLPRLGGFRRALADSPNTAWRNASFRGYADYMRTDDFDEAIDELRDLAGRARTAIMCSEAVPWRCHRTLIADALTVRGVAVTHLMGKRVQEHTLTSFAVVEDERVTYPSADEPLAQPVES